MAANGSQDAYRSFLGTGWSFPPEFTRNGRDVVMTSDEDDIHASLVILFGTVRGERFMIPGYGLDPHELLFEPASTTMKAFLKDRITVAILIQEPRIRVLALDVDTPDPNAGVLRISLDYEVRATNSRYNLVYPFYRHDSSEMLGTIAGKRAPG
jgi:phage baseplate assembly protein W